MCKNIPCFLLAASIIFIGQACTSNKASNLAVNHKSIPVIEISSRDTVLSVPYVAAIQGKKNVELHARIGGILEKIYISEGQQVREGQLLFKINDSELQIELSKAQAAYSSAIADANVAKVDVERVKILVEKNVITQPELELARAKHNALLAKVDVALAEKQAVEKRISYTSILAPFEGLIDRIPLKQGSLLAPNSLLTTLSDINSVYAYFNVSEKEYFQIVQNGNNLDVKEISLVLPDGTLYPHFGKLQNAESEINVGTGNIAFKAAFPNPDKILRHGASGKLYLTKPLQNAILIPQKSVFGIQDKDFIFLVGKDNKLKMQGIETAQRVADHYLVTAGLKADDCIVYEGIQSLREGDKILPLIIQN